MAFEVPFDLLVLTPMARKYSDILAQRFSVRLSSSSCFMLLDLDEYLENQTVVLEPQRDWSLNLEEYIKKPVQIFLDAWLWLSTRRPWASCYQFPVLFKVTILWNGRTTQRVEKVLVRPTASLEGTRCCCANLKTFLAFRLWPLLVFLSTFPILRRMVIAPSERTHKNFLISEYRIKSFDRHKSESMNPMVSARSRHSFCQSQWPYGLVLQSFSSHQFRQPITSMNSEQTIPGPHFQRCSRCKHPIITSRWLGQVDLPKCSGRIIERTNLCCDQMHQWWVSHEWKGSSAHREWDLHF
jgi:hypothetical protein